MIEDNNNLNIRWTRHRRGLAEDSDYRGMSMVRDGGVAYVAQDGEKVVSDICRGETVVRIDRSGGRGQIIDLVYLRPEVSGWRLDLAKVLDRFDRSRLGKWWDAEPSKEELWLKF